MARIFLPFIRSRNLSLAGLLAVLILAPLSIEAPVAHAASAPAIRVRAGVHPDFDRLVFDWPRTVAYKVQRHGARVTVYFAAAGKADFHDLDSAHMTRARGISAMNDAEGHLLVSFLADPHAIVRDFTSGTSVAIDIRGAAAPEKAPPVAEATPESKPAPEPPPVTAEAPPPIVAPPAQAPPPAAPPQDTVQKSADSSTPPPSSPASAPETSQASAPAAAPSPPPVAAKPEVLVTPPSLANASSAPVAAPAAPVSRLLPELGTAAQLVVALDPHVATRAAIYQRAGFAYIVFDRKFSLDLAALTAGQSPPLVDLEPLDLAKASGWRFPVPAEAEIRATREGTVWHIFLSKQHVEIPVSTALVAQPDFALGARFLLPLPDAPEPVTFTDPVVGDRLILIPLGETEAFSVARRMADFHILPAAQGLVIEPFSDRLVVRAVSDGIEITAEGGLKLSRPSDTGAAQESAEKVKAAASGKSLFDLTAWRGKPNETFTETRQRLQQTIVDVPEAERNRARLELARFYFANGNGEEAAALLHYLAILVPDLTTHADFMALLGATQIAAYQPDDGLAAFDNYDLKGQPEIELWEAVGDAELRNWTAAEEKFAVTQSILAGYPEPFYSRFSVLAVESALAVGKDREGKDWLDRLENSQHRAEIDPAIEYLHGVIHSKEGRAQAAEELWKEVAELSDRLYRVRAELALVDLDVATGALTPAKAADRLEALRFGWRGDDLELDILHRLGQFYVQAKNVKAGLGILSQAIQLYPKSPLTPQIRAEMAGIFHDVFLGDLAPDLSVVDALTLYQQYRDLMPTGADGIAVMRNLAERLVSIDLLDQAAGLLEDLVKGRLQGIEKGRVGARLAAIRILDHKPDAALAALDMSNDNTYPADLLGERQLLRAKALSELNRSDEALELLKGNDTRDAITLRADVLMHAQHWSDAAKNLLELIGPPPKAGEMLSAQQADWLVSCAIALSLANEQDGLNKLAVDFSASMAAMPQNDTFRVLTQPEKAAQLKDISAVQAKISEVDLFRGFLNAYRSAPTGDTPRQQAGTPANPDQNNKP